MEHWVLSIFKENVQQSMFNDQYSVLIGMSVKLSIENGALGIECF